LIPPATTPGGVQPARSSSGDRPAPSLGADRPARTSRINLKVLAAGLAVIAPLLVVLILNIDRDPHSVRSPLLGRPAPGFSLAPLGGGPAVTLESFRGRPVVINFWATWCVPCLAEHADLRSAALAFRDVQFLGIVYEDEAARSEAFLQQRGSSYPSLLDPDGRTAIAYGVFGVPETFIVDSAGRLIDKVAGPVDRGTLDALVARAKGGAP
jgi:cytochrome c biogenesis protein CcmG/thiol:disulfide interchange protein DsbE